MELRKRVVSLDDYQNQPLRTKISLHATNAKRDSMLKDTHLLEAALITDQIVASKEVKARKYFAAVCRYVSEIRHLMWVNPVLEIDSCKEWLKKGAPVEPERQLVNYISR